jgi:hypothetical protein
VTSRLETGKLLTFFYSVLKLSNLMRSPPLLAGAVTGSIHGGEGKK